MSEFEVEIKMNMLCKPGRIHTDTNKRNNRRQEFHHTLEEVDSDKKIQASCTYEL